MASKCGRFINRTKLNSMKSCFTKSTPKSAAPPPVFRSPTSSPPPRFTFSRIPNELGCVASMMPLHNAVATARMTSCLSVTSRDCRALSQDEIDDS